MKCYTVFPVVHCFCKARGIVQCQATHKAQENPQQKSAMVTSFMKTTQQLLAQGNRDKQFIINMDQSLFNLKKSNKKTLARKGSKTINTKEMKMLVGHITVS